MMEVPVSVTVWGAVEVTVVNALVATVLPGTAVPQITGGTGTAREGRCHSRGGSARQRGGSPRQHLQINADAVARCGLVAHQARAVRHAHGGEPLTFHGVWDCQGIAQRSELDV